MENKVPSMRLYILKTAPELRYRIGVKWKKKIFK
jgi:hypothetical protein